MRSEATCWSVPNKRRDESGRLVPECVPPRTTRGVRHHRTDQEPTVLGECVYTSCSAVQPSSAGCGTHMRLWVGRIAFAPEGSILKGPKTITGASFATDDVTCR